jgi:hypothetical protein
MQITYQLTEHDFSVAYRTHRDSKKLVKWGLRFFVGFVGFMFMLKAYLAVSDPSERTPGSIAPMLGLLIFWTLTLWALPRWGMLRQFRNQPGAQGPRTVTFDTDGGGAVLVTSLGRITFAGQKAKIRFFSTPLLSASTSSPSENYKPQN